MLLRTSKKTIEEPAEAERLPIPTQIVSNGEYWPSPQTPTQRTVERLINVMAEERARKLGWSRRRFLRSACGTATALMALNIVHGCGGDSDPSAGGFAVDDCATRDPAAARERFTADVFIMDVQTHHVDLEGPVSTNPGLADFFRSYRFCAPATIADGSCHPGVLNELSRANFLKEVFLDSETAIAIMSGIPAPSRSFQALSNEAMAATRDVANELGASQRMLTQGMLTPNFPPRNNSGTNIEDMEHLVKDLGIVALKTYTGAGAGPNFTGFNTWGSIKPWWLDDEKVSYPMLAEAERLGIRIVNTHKGLRLGIFDPDYIHPRDVPKAARDWPQMNFVIYHSAGEYLDELVELKRTQIPEATNVYAELGSIFAGNVLNDSFPDSVGHLLGKLINAFGADHVIWGTDAIWWGSPQWQIDALKTFRMPQRLIEENGYPEITDQIKAQIFGGNAARLYGIDTNAVRCTLPSDMVAQAKLAYPDVRQPSLRTYGPKTRREFIKLAFSGGNPLA
jgi:predicted TIM-barrel fold metal-dependent hydrolase